LTGWRPMISLDAGLKHTIDAYASELNYQTIT